jgi:hypothetical protein
MESRFYEAVDPAKPDAGRIIYIFGDSLVSVTTDLITQG